MSNPMKDIEDKKANQDMGRLAVQVFEGAQSETESWLEAFWSTVAFFCGMFKSSQEPENKDKDD